MSRRRRGCTKYTQRLENDWTRVFWEAITSTTEQKFTCLKNLSITSTRLDDLVPIFQLPVLETLKVWKISPLKSLKVWSIPQSSSSIKILELRASYVDSVTVAQVLKSIETLKQFPYCHSADANHCKPSGLHFRQFIPP